LQPPIRRTDDAARCQTRQPVRTMTDSSITPKRYRRLQPQQPPAP
jgi:hypothetical protein